MLIAECGGRRALRFLRRLLLLHPQLPRLVGEAAAERAVGVVRTVVIAIPRIRLSAFSHRPRI